MMTIVEKELEFIKAFNDLEDWMVQYDYLLMQTATMEPVSHDELCEKYVVKGCQSRIWLIIDVLAGKVHLRAESHSLLIKGILNILITLLNGHDIPEVMAYQIHFLNGTAIGQQLTADRFIGITSILDHIKNVLAQTQTHCASSQRPRSLLQDL